MFNLFNLNLDLFICYSNDLNGNLNNLLDKRDMSIQKVRHNLEHNNLFSK